MINEVAERLGHSDPGFTARTYTNIYREAHTRRGVPIEDTIRRAREGRPEVAVTSLFEQPDGAVITAASGRRQPWPW
jgi:hypothetical protein